MISCHWVKDYAVSPQHGWMDGQVSCLLPWNHLCTYTNNLLQGFSPPPPEIWRFLLLVALMLLLQGTSGEYTVSI